MAACRVGVSRPLSGVGSLGGMLKRQATGELEEVGPSVLADRRFHKIWAWWVNPGIIECVVTAGRKLPVTPRRTGGQGGVGQQSRLNSGALIGFLSADVTGFH